MKKFLTIFFATIFGVSTLSAQNFSVEAVAGMNVSNWGGLGSKVGFHAGARAELALPSLADGIYTNTALLFSSKGCKQDYGDLGKATTDAYYLELPIHIGYKFSVTDNFAVFGEAGPYVGYGLFGKSKADYGDDGYSSSYDEDETSETFDMADRFDVGVGLRVGVEFKRKYSISLGYDWGLINSYNSNDSDDYNDNGYYEIDLTPSMKHANLTISLGYKF